MQCLCTRGKPLPMNRTASQILGARALRDFVTQNPLCAVSSRFIIHRGKQKEMH